MYRRKVVEFIFVLVMCSSCNLIYNTQKEDQYTVCYSNCYDLNFHGSIVNKITNTGIDDIPVTLNWKKPTCLFCTDNMIDKRVSDEQGGYVFANSIDTSYFANGYQLVLSIPYNNDYIIFPWENNYVIHSITDSRLSQLKYDLYPRTQLTIQVERAKTDTFETFTVGHNFRNDFQYVDRIITKESDGQYSYPLNDTYKVETSADIKTYIKWTKVIKSVKYESIDSIVCRKSKDNIYKIKY